MNENLKKIKRLPIARAEFRSFTYENFCYVDKTQFIKQLESEGTKYFFLSRPRRFGKSLFLDTLRAAFAGEKELFVGLFLENNWDWETKYPVIKVSFGGATISNIAEFQNSTNFSLNIIAESYQVELAEKNFPATAFKELINKLTKKYNLPVVVLIDEYDKPLLDNITKPEAKVLREELASFYSILKEEERNLKFVFITGVSKFSKTSIFSKLNNIVDISLNVKYADICGYTQDDLEHIFVDYLHDVDLEKVKSWYDGYNFLGKNLYNPFDVLLFLNEKKYKPYWFETGTPTFLLELIKERKYHVPSLENVTISLSQLTEFDIDRIDLIVLLFQAGYLTIAKEEILGDEYFYDLKIPNKEVRKGLYDYLLRMFYAIEADTNTRTKLSIAIYNSIANKKPEDLENAFKSFFAGIPHDWYRKNNISEFEGFYSALFYAFFAALGFDLVAEDTTNKGKIDLTVFSNTNVFIFEFKMKNNQKNALQQIKDKKYHEKYIKKCNELYLVGIEFDEDEKNISNFEYEKIQ